MRVPRPRLPAAAPRRYRVDSQRRPAPPAAVRATPRLAAAMVLLLACVIAGGGAPRAEEEAGAPIGSGDGRIHVIPSIAPYSVKNGETLTVTAIVRSERPVASVEADLAGLATVTLQPNARLGGVSADGTTGIWTAEWIAAGLEEKVYAATLTVTDIDGHAWTDHSLLFSDPAAGNSTPGTAQYPDGGMGRVGELVFPATEAAGSAAVDAEAGYAYFGTAWITEPGHVIKVALSTGGNPPTRVGAVILEEEETSLYAAVIDPVAGYAYFGTGTIPGRVVKVALGEGDAPPTRVGSVTLADGENFIGSAVIDPAAGYAYFGTAGRIVKVALGNGDALPTRVGSIALHDDESYFRPAVIDTAAGYAYFGAHGNSALGSITRVVKVALGEGDALPTRVGAVTLESGDVSLAAAMIDVASGYAWFGTNYGRVVKVALGAGSAPPTRVGGITLASGERFLGTAIKDGTAGYGYFGTDTYPAYVVKVALGEGDDPPTRIGAYMLDAESHVSAGVIDTAAGHAYFGTDGRPGSVVKFSLGEGSDLPKRIAALNLDDGLSNLPIAAIDPAGYAYLSGSSEQVVKVALGDGNQPPTRLGGLTLPYREKSTTSAVIDASAGYMWFGTATIPGMVVKVALGEGDDLPARVGAITVADGEDNLTTAVADLAAGYAYFGTGRAFFTGRVVKVALGIGDDLPTRVGAVTLDDGEELLYSSVIDAAAGYAYLGTGTSPGQVVKVALGAGDNPPTRVGAVTLDPGEDRLRSAVIDTTSGYAWFGTGTSPGRVVKVALGNGDEPPIRVGAVVLDAGENDLRAAVLDGTDGHAYFGTNSFPARLVKVALGDGGDPPSRVGALPLESEERQIVSAMIDIAAGYAYVGAGTSVNDSARGLIVKVALSHGGQLRASRFTMPEPGTITSARFYSHAAGGVVRLAIYDDAEPKGLLWESDPLANTAAGEFLVVPIADGTPPTLDLEAGTYWAAWQVDASTSVASWTQGGEGEGFAVSHEFGPAPATLPANAVTMTTDRWTQYVTYDAFFDPNQSAMVMR